jgi:hypothetical protein
VERADGGDEGDMTQEPSPLASPSTANEELETRQSSESSRTGYMTPISSS